MCLVDHQRSSVITWSDDFDQSTSLFAPLLFSALAGKNDIAATLCGFRVEQ